MSQSLPSRCASCEAPLSRTSVYHDGAEIPLIVCEQEGLYAVVGMAGGPVMASADTPTTTQHITVTTEFGDDLVLAANPQQGFYTTSESEVRQLAGESSPTCRQ